MKIGIIGGDGFVGSGIRRFLGKNDANVASINRGNYGRFAGSEFDVLINANGNSKKYLAAQAPKDEFRASVESVQHSLLDFKFGLYIHCSSIDVYPDHEHPVSNTEETSIDPKKLSLYGFHKYLSEQIVRQYAKRWMILRFGGFVGKGLKKNSIFDILHGVPLRVHVESKYQYLPTETAGEIIWKLMDGKLSNEIFNVCGEGCTSLGEIIKEVPTYGLSYAVENPPIEHYEVNIQKLKRFLPVPLTQNSVRDFVHSYKETNS